MLIDSNNTQINPTSTNREICKRVYIIIRPLRYRLCLNFYPLIEILIPVYWICLSFRICRGDHLTAKPIKSCWYCTAVLGLQPYHCTAATHPPPWKVARWVDYSMWEHFASDSALVKQCFVYSKTLVPVSESPLGKETKPWCNNYFEHARGTFWSKFNLWAAMRDSCMQVISHTQWVEWRHSMCKRNNSHV